ncbi:MAG: DUF5077 domain-containing protein, partial [Leadbetterella sp.]|nr:DUF5077 domain-containing protein [Leadbetterella sp.]
MLKLKRIGFIISLFIISGCKSIAIPLMVSHDPNPQKIPLGGNAWVTNGAEITEKGLENWTNSDQVCKVYFKVNKAGKLKLSVFSEAVSSKIKISISGKSKVIELKGEAETMAGEWDIEKAVYV